MSVKMCNNDTKNIRSPNNRTDITINKGNVKNIHRYV